MEYKLKNQLDIFLKMEKNNSLFDIKSPYGYSIWEAIRFDVWTKLFSEKTLINNNKKKLNFLFTTLKVFFSIKNIFFNRYDYLYLSFSRSVNSYNEFYDPFYDILNLSKDKKFLVIEKSIDKKKYYLKNNVQDFLYYLNKIICRIPFLKNAYTSKEEINKILFCLKSSFNSAPFSHDEISSLITAFHFQRKFYKWLLKYKNIKKVFFTANEKSLLLASKELGVPTYEFQHGDIIETTFLYKYQDYHLKNNKDSLIYSDFLFLYSNIWEKHINRPSKIIELGSFFFDFHLPKNKIKNNSIAIISSPLQNILLQSIAKKLSLNDKNLKIYYKLHPSQYHLFDDHIEIFRNYSNIQLVPLNESISNLATYIDEFVAYYSTVIYELIQYQKIIYLVKGKFHFALKDYFYLPNIFLIDDPNQISELSKNKNKNKIKNDKISFFKPFNKIKLLEILES